MNKNTLSVHYYHCAYYYHRVTIITVEISFGIGSVFLVELIKFQVHQGKLFCTVFLLKMRSSENPTPPVQEAHTLIRSV